MTRKRQTAVHASVKLEQGYEKLSQLHAELLTYIDNVNVYLSSDPRWDIYHRKLLCLVDKIIAQRRDVEPLQREVIDAQWKIKSTEEDLYGEYNEGLPADESEACLEDLVLEAKLQFDQDVASAISETSPIGPTLYQAQTNRASEDVAFGDRHGTRLLVDDGDDECENIRGKSMAFARLHMTETRTSTPCGNSGISSKRKSREGRFTHADARRSSSVGLEALGRWAPDKPQTNIDNSLWRDPLICASRQVEEARRTDLKFVLGSDIDMIDAEMKFLVQPSNTSVLVKPLRLADLNVPVIHMSQFIAFWGSSMSSNAVSEAYRIFLYGGIRRHELLRHLEGEQLVRVVRGFHEPLDSSPDESPPLFESLEMYGYAHRDARSLDVQASVMTETPMQTLFEYTR